MPEEQLETLDQAFVREYQTLVSDIKSVRKLTIPKISHQIPILDVTVKIIFDEDLTLMLFPKVQEFEFRANSGSPVELCAKILAI
jgi:predicted metal-dependent HD superfamily phosphohydrolase